ENFEIVDLATDAAANTVEFDLSDFDSIGNAMPLHILGGANDSILLTNHYGQGATWNLIDDDVTAHEVFPFDLFPNLEPENTYFDIFEVTIGEGQYLVYVQNEVQITIPNNAPTAGDVTLEVNVLGNGGFETTPD